MQILDANLGGITALSLTGIDVSLSQTQCNNGMLRLTGALVNNITISPTLGATMSGFFYFENLTTNSAYSVTFSNAGGSVVLPQGRRGTMWIDTTYGPRIIAVGGSTAADPVPTGSVLTFYNSAAPSGYTAVTMNDFGIRVVNTGTSGGTTTGSVAYSTVFARTATDSYTLTVADIPSHTHSISAQAASSAFTAGGGPVNTPYWAGNVTATNATGGGGAHSHAIEMRVQTAAVIMATRN